jgi:acetamidase/formamidase
MAMAEHRLDPTPQTVTDVFCRDLPPVLTVGAGDRLVVRTLNCAGHLSRPNHPGQDAPSLLNPRRGHCLVGPIAVRDARPGMALAIQLEQLRPDPWGFTVAGGRDTPLNRHLGVADGAPVHLLWDLDIEQSTAVNDLGFTVDLAPFLGVLGLAPDEPGEHSTIPPRARSGGNIDCRELIAGSTLYLPVTVPGALLSVGDGHGAQGDGEVGGTAIECGMTTTMTLDLVPDPAVPTIHAVTPASRITFGFHPDLNEAMADALDAMVGWMRTLYGVDKPCALALASTSVDLRITQVANQTWGVHAVLPHNALRGAAAEREGRGWSGMHEVVR